MSASAPGGGAEDLRARASLGRRLAALAYEGLLLAALLLVVGFLTLPLVGAGSGTRMVVIPGPAGRAFSACLVFAAAGAYFTWCWSGGRQTLAMKTWGLRLVQIDGNLVDVKRALRRYFAAWVGPLAALGAYAALEPAGLSAHGAWLLSLNFLWAFVDRDRAFLHDRIAGTRIVKVPRA